MKRASAILESTRLDRELDFEEISKRTRIPTHYLLAFENETTSDFPSEPYCSLMVKDYAEFLGLNGEEILSIFRRDYDQKSQKFHPRHSFFSFTPQLALKLFIILLLIIFSLFLIYEYLKFNRPPKLTVNWPDNLSTKTVEISGNTDPMATIKINDSLVIVDSKGNFKKTIDIASSEAKITVEAKSPAGVISTDEKNIK